MRKAKQDNANALPIKKILDPFCNLRRNISVCAVKKVIHFVKEDQGGLATFQVELQAVGEIVGKRCFQATAGSACRA